MRTGSRRWVWTWRRLRPCNWCKCRPVVLNSEPINELSIVQAEGPQSRKYKVCETDSIGPRVLSELTAKSRASLKPPQQHEPRTRRGWTSKDCSLITHRTLRRVDFSSSLTNRCAKFSLGSDKARTRHPHPPQPTTCEYLRHHVIPSRVCSFSSASFCCCLTNFSRHPSSGAIKVAH